VHWKLGNKHHENIQGTREKSNAPKKLGNILDYAWHMKKNGWSDSTCETAIHRLKLFNKLCDIHNPDQIKTVLATANWKPNTKHHYTTTIHQYLQFKGIKWNKPKYKRENSTPFIPTEEELDSLISNGNTNTATLLQILKETGARIGEILPSLKWIDLDFSRKTITIRKPEKGSNSRILPISNKLIGMLNNLPKINERVFQTSKLNARRTYNQLRIRTIKKLANPRLKEIKFHTFRHWKATMEYHKTKDIIHVKTILGHKCIETTMIYIHIEASLWQASNDEWTCKATTNDNEATQLIESGFEYTMTTPNGLMLFRKRK